LSLIACGGKNRVLAGRDATAENNSSHLNVNPGLRGPVSPCPLAFARGCSELLTPTNLHETRRSIPELRAEKLQDIIG